MFIDYFLTFYSTAVVCNHRTFGNTDLKVQAGKIIVHTVTYAITSFYILRRISVTHYSLSLSLHVLYFLFTPTGQGRWLPSRVRVCLRFLPTGEFFLATVALNLFWRDQWVSLSLCEALWETFGCDLALIDSLTYTSQTAFWGFSVGPVYLFVICIQYVGSKPHSWWTLRLHFCELLMCLFVYIERADRRGKTTHKKPHKLIRW